MRAIVHSIHSQVPATVSELGLRLDAIVSMDSHLDVSLGGDYSVYPEELRVIAARTGAHSALRSIMGGSSEKAPEFVLVVPEAMLARHAMDVEAKLPRSLRFSDQGESVASAVEFLAETMGMEVYPSPPRPLQGLARRMKRAGSWLLDVDVDYMQEMQREVYTRIINPAPGVLQSMSRVLEFVRASRPETITISEAKVAAIRDAKSRFSSFVRALEEEGYQVEERGVYASDADVVRAISVCKEFYRTVSRRLMLEHMDAMMSGDMRGFQEAEAAEARRFFRAKGYA